jgi:hypothetical protein
MSRSFRFALAMTTLLAIPAYADAPKQLPADAGTVPAAIRPQGRIRHVLRWQDVAGENWLVMSSRSDAGGAAWLHAHLYLSRGGTFTLLREVKDHEGKCDYDQSTDFLPGSFGITDLDGNGTAEVTFAYRMACRSDVSPSTLKLLLLEGTAKYILRGESSVQVSATERVGGKYKVDDSFRTGPAAFLKHAEALWKKVVAE